MFIEGVIIEREPMSPNVEYNRCRTCWTLGEWYLWCILVCMLSLLTGGWVAEVGVVKT